MVLGESEDDENPKVKPREYIVQKNLLFTEEAECQKEKKILHWKTDLI